MNTFCERSTPTPISSRSGRRQAMRSYAACNASSPRIITSEAPASAEYPKVHSMKARSYNVKHAGAEDARLVIDNTIPFTNTHRELLVFLQHP